MIFQISPIADIHAESFRACLDAVAREKKYLAQIEALPLERIQALVRDNIAADVAHFVALDGPRVIGWCDIFPAWAHALQHRGSLGMGVLAEYRGRGIGKQLLLTCIAKAWIKGLTRIELETRVDNQRAIRLYERVGFVHEIRKKNALRYEGVYYDALQMSLVYQGAE